jgi:hypothetical protein
MRRLLVFAAFGSLVLAAAPAIDASERAGPGDLGQHQSLAEHERSAFGPGPPSSLVLDNFELVGHSNLAGGAPTGDVFLYDHGGSVGTYAYLGSWAVPCAGTGVRIVDVNDPSHPRLVAFAAGAIGTSAEDPVVTRIGTRDVLAVGLQTCKKQGVPGLDLWDVTNPRRPTHLAFLQTGPDGPHETDIVTRADGRSLALFAVPFSEGSDQFEGTTFGGDFRIVEITDPENPVELADWGVTGDSSMTIEAGNDPWTSVFQGIGQFPDLFAHSARAADGGMTAYVSYWDAGVLKFDITDPSNPVLLGSTDYPIDAEGEAHSVVPYDSGGQRYLLQNDEDFDTFSPVVVTTTATGSAEYAGIQEPWMPTLLYDTGPITAGVHDAGDGCQAADYAGASGQIALADTQDPFYVTPPCSIGAQAILAAQSGAVAFLSNLVSQDDAYAFGPDTEAEFEQVQQEAVGTPGVQISDIDELAAAIRAGGPGVELTLTPSDPSWGFLRVFQEGAGDADGDGIPDFQQVGSFRDLPHTSGELFTPPGVWSIHNTEINGDRAYSSWYSHGLVALDIGDPTSPAKVGQFVPSTNPRHGKELRFFDGPALVWGVAIDPDTGLIYVSDMRTGLWIVEPTGDAAPTP